MAWCNNPEKPRTLYPSRHKSPSSPSDLQGNLMARHYTVNLVYAQRKRALSRTHPEKWMCEWAGKHTFMRLKVKWQNYVLVFKIICEGRGDGSEGEDGSLAAETDDPSLTPNLWPPGPTWWRNIADSWELSSDCCTCACPHPAPLKKLTDLGEPENFFCFMLVLTETSERLFFFFFF